MEYTHLGKSGLVVSRLCLGTMNFGPRTSEEDAFAIMDTASDSGINLFDTANAYGRQMGKGFTEQIIGRWFKQGGGRRGKIILATKVYNRMGDWPNQSRLSAFHIRQACEASLKRLQTDHIDIYQMHHIYRQAAWDEIYQAMEILIKEGKVIYVGSSNFAGWHIVQAQEAARRRHFLGLVSEQSLYNLKDRMVELEVMPACRDYGLGLLVWSPLAGGFLGGVLRKIEDGQPVSENLKIDIEKFRPQLEEWEKFCEQMGERPANVALAWLLSRSDVTAPIVGPRTLDQLTECLPAIDLKLNGDEMMHINTIWPGIGEAPEAYAW